jgi:GTPase
VLVGAPIKRSSSRHYVDEHLDELERLADTAGAVVVDRLTQALDRPHAGTYLGKGKIDELRDLLQEREATLVLFDDELSPAQAKNVEQAVNTRVMDRAELILDIFATRARSSEAKMQVELAQLQYTLPRLTRMWAHLEKFRGGIGVRGPGETQLETDRRLIGRRISELRRKLTDVSKSRAVQRQGRENSFRASLVGYTNAGKSSLLKALSGSDLFVEDRLFATLDSATRAVPLGSGQEALLTDTVGFIRKLPHDLVASFRSTLEEAREADVLLHVIDASHSDWEEQYEVVNAVLEDLGLEQQDTILVFNKIDRLTHAEEQALRERIRGIAPEPAVFVSAHDERTLEALRETLRTRLLARLAHVVVNLPSTDGEAIAALYREGEVVGRAEEDSRVMLTAWVPRAVLGRIAARSGVRVESVA